MESLQNSVRHDDADTDDDRCYGVVGVSPITARVRKYGSDSKNQCIATPEDVIARDIREEGVEFKDRQKEGPAMNQWRKMRACTYNPHIRKLFPKTRRN